ncbi:hypothetical protein EGW08_002346, partial [Elysia chlorotica]
MLAHSFQKCLPRILLLLMISCSAALKIKACPCPDESHCQYPKEDLGTNAEVFAFSNGTTDVQGWKWDTLTTLVVPATFMDNNTEQLNTMCIAHSKGRKFSITEPMVLKRPLDVTSEDTDKWIETMLQRVRVWHADILTVDLLHYFSYTIEDTNENLVALAMILLKIKKDVTEVSQAPFK